MFGLFKRLVERKDQNQNTLNPSGALPVAVQTFPTTDNFSFEPEKQAVANLAETLFASYENEFSKRLSTVHEEVGRHMSAFIQNIRNASGVSGAERMAFVSQALGELSACSPQLVLAEFQKQSLFAGWVYVTIFNRAIDRLAELFPRCRAGIYASRLKYSDVLQISSEITETLRSCSTLIDDLQRRYESLESLQNDIRADIETPEAEMIFAAMKETFADNKRYSEASESQSDNKGWFKAAIGKVRDVVSQTATAFGDAMSFPALQIQGQMQRTRRMYVFLETAKVLSSGWDDWRKASQEIILPNLSVMFLLKRDFFRNQMICLCDTITCNGYALKNVAQQLRIAAENDAAVHSIAMKDSVVV